MWSARVIWLPRELCLKLLWEATPARPLMPGLYPQCFLRFTWTPVWWLFFPQVDGCKYGNSVGVREAHLTQRSDPLSSPKRGGGEEFLPPLLPPREKICVLFRVEGSRNPVLSPYPYAPASTYRVLSYLPLSSRSRSRWAGIDRSSGGGGRCLVPLRPPFSCYAPNVSQNIALPPLFSPGNYRKEGGQFFGIFVDPNHWTVGTKNSSARIPA